MILPEIISENERRKKELFSYYNPITGEGSPIPRFKVNLGSSFIYLPEIIKPLYPDELWDDLPGTCKKNGIPVEDMMKVIEHIRYAHDFEYWCARCVKITDKGGSDLMYFKLRYSQRILFARLYKMFSDGLPVKALLLKARQFGGSTLIQIFMVWLQFFHFKNWNSLIFGNKESQARVIRGMYSRLLKYHPKDVMEVSFSPFEGSSKTKILNEGDRDCVISIGSMSDPEGARSEDIRMAHLTEVASWKKTEGKTPEDVTQNVRATIPNIIGAVEILESTAKGVGNFWHTEWLSAKRGESGFDPIFIPFFLIEMYYNEFDSEEERNKLIKGILNPITKQEERSLSFWNKGATLESINWYWEHKRKNRYSDWRMSSEFPGDDIEAFQSSEMRAFDPDYIQRARKNNCAPTFIGDIIGDAPKGKDAFVNLRLVENSQGALKIWYMPDLDTKIANRYIVSMDIGGKGDKADWSVIRVLDRYWMMEGGVPEAILTYTNHLDHDLLAYKGAQIAKFYNNALFVPESNTYDKENITEGDHIITVLDQVLPFYSNIYCRTDPEKIRQGAPIRYGFHTNTKTKPDLIATINAAFRDEDYIEYDEDVCNEADAYSIIDGNKYGSAPGTHDDKLMATAIALKVSDIIPVPSSYDNTKIKRTRVIKGSAAVI